MSPAMMSGRAVVLGTKVRGTPTHTLCIGCGRPRDPDTKTRRNGTGFCKDCWGDPIWRMK